MKKRINILAATVLAAIAATPVLADEPTDCFYEANQSHALCQAGIVSQAPVDLFAEPEYLVLQSASDETVDCFYDANRSNALCAAAPEMIVMHGAE
jgi:hypothetical protein